MATDVVKTIDPTGGGDYLTLAAWKAARKGDLVARDTREIAKVRGGGSVGEIDFLPADWTMDATRYAWVLADEGHEHPGCFASDKAYIRGVTDTPVNIRVGGARFGPGITVFNDVDSGEIFGPTHGIFVSSIPAGQPPVVAEGNVVKVYAGICFRAEYCDVGTFHVCKNNILLRGSASATGVRATNSSVVAYANTIQVGGIGIHADNDGGIYGPPAAPGTVISQNNYIAAAVDYLVEGAGSSISEGSADVTDDEVAYVAAGFLNPFLHLAGGPERSFEDLHLSASSPLRGQGADLQTSIYPGAAVTNDMDGHARPVAPDVGALQFTVPVEVVRSVGTGGDFATWDAWKAGRGGNLARRDTVEVAELLADTFVAPRLEGKDFCVNLKNRVVVRAAPSAAHAGRFDAAKAYIKNAPGSRDAFFCSLGATRVGPGLSIESSFYTGGDDPRGIQFQDCVRGGPVLVDGCIVKQAVVVDAHRAISAANCTYDSALPHVVRNCANSMGGGNTTQNALWLHGEWRVYHCTLYAFGSASNGITADSGRVICDDNYIAASNLSYAVASGGTIVKGVHDATDNDDALTPALRQIHRDTSVFVDPLPAGYPNVAPDFHLAIGSPLVGVGADVGVTTDFDGADRQTPFDIGADQQANFRLFEADLEVLVGMAVGLTVGLAFAAGPIEGRTWTGPAKGNTWNG